MQSRLLHASLATLMMLVCASAAAQRSPALERIARSGEIALGHREASVPFSYVGADGAPTGYAVDVCSKLVDALRRDLGLKSLRIRYVQNTTANRIELVKSAKVDIDCAGTTNTAARRAEVAFGVSHFVSGMQLLSRSDAKMEKLSDLYRRRVANLKGSVAERYFLEKSATLTLGLEFVTAKDVQDVVRMVEDRSADVFGYADVLLYAARVRSRDPAGLAIGSAGSFTIEPLAVFFSKDAPNPKSIVDAEMRRMIRAGELKALYTKWFLSRIPKYDINLEFPMSPLVRDLMKYPSDYSLP